MSVTIHDVARRAGVSIATVSRVLNNTCKVREDKRLLVLEAARDLGYSPNPAALSLLNNKFSLTMARHFASRLEKEAKDLPSRVRLGHKLVTGRYPNGDERKLLVSYGGKHGLQNLCRALYNLSEFSYLD